MDNVPPGLPVLYHPLESIKLMPTASVTPSSHLVLCRPLLLLPSIVPNIRLFSRESFLLIRWPKYLSFIFRIWPSKEQSGLISSRTDRFDRLAVQGTRRSLLQHHSSKASILWHSVFLMVQLLLPTTSQRPVRSHREGLLRVPSAKQCRLVTPRGRAFSVGAPTLWNQLPPEIRRIQDLSAFRRALKTHFFQQAELA